MAERAKKEPMWGMLVNSDPNGVQKAFELRKNPGVVAHPVGGRILILGYRGVPKGAEPVPVARSYDGRDDAIIICGEDGRPLPRKGGFWVGEHCRVVISINSSVVVVDRVMLKGGAPAIAPVFEGHILRLPKKYLAAAEAGYRWLAHPEETRGRDCYVAGGGHRELHPKPSQEPKKELEPAEEQK